MFAPAHHGATRFVVPVRKELAVRTIFNFLGPLTNPAGATRQVIGVSDAAFLDTIAGALAQAGRPQGAGSVQRRRSGRDEHVGDNAGRRGRRPESSARYEVSPEDVGLAARAIRRTLAGGTPDDNAATTRRIFAGEPGPQRDLARAQRGRGDLRRRPRRHARGGRRARPRRRSTTAARPRALDALVEMTQELAPA